MEVERKNRRTSTSPTVYLPPLAPHTEHLADKRPTLRCAGQAFGPAQKHTSSVVTREQQSSVYLLIGRYNPKSCGIDSTVYGTGKNAAPVLTYAQMKTPAREAGALESLRLANSE